MYKSGGSVNRVGRGKKTQTKGGQEKWNLESSEQHRPDAGARVTQTPTERWQTSQEVPISLMGLLFQIPVEPHHKNNYQRKKKSAHFVSGWHSNGSDGVPSTHWGWGQRRDSWGLRVRTEVAAPFNKSQCAEPHFDTLSEKRAEQEKQSIDFTLTWEVQWRAED